VRSPRPQSEAGSWGLDESDSDQRQECRAGGEDVSAVSGSSRRSTGLYLPGKVAGKHIHYLVDSGCTRNLLSKVVFDRLPASTRAELVPCRRSAEMADGSGLPLYGLIRLKGKLRSVPFEDDFMVAKIMDDAIIGLSFLQENECTVVFNRSTLLVGDISLQCTDKYGQALANRVHVLREIIVPPRSELVVTCRLVNEPACRLGLVEQFSPVGLDIGIASCLVTHDDRYRVPVRCLNPTNQSIKLRAGTAVGVFAPIAEGDVSLLEGRETLGEAKVITSAETSGSTVKPVVPVHCAQLLEDASALCSSEQERSGVARLLSEYADVFSSGPTDVGRTSLVEHSIPVFPGTKPIRHAPRRLGPEKDSEVERQVGQLVEQGMVEPHHGAWSSPVVLVRKKDSSWRLCIDYRQLNAVTHRDAYPLPRIDDSLDSLAGSRYFSTLDLLSGYWQVPLDTDAQEKSAFVTRGGLWKWKVLPFGLTSAPASFERLMERVLSGLQWKTLLLYLDDVIVFASDFDSHIERLREVFKRFRYAGLKLKPSKCELFRSKVKYLGHEVSAGGVSTDPGKIEAVKEWSTPKCASELRTFLGFAGYYRRFCPDFATVAKPLNRLTAKGVEFCWQQEHDDAFERLKGYLLEAPVLAYPDPSCEFLLDTDASLDGAGAVLSQVQEGEERVIAYFSKTFSPCERNYCVTRRELLAVVLACKHFRSYLYGRKFTVRTDHASLVWLHRRREPSQQVARWLEILSEFSFRIEHRAGRHHGNADGLSRVQCADCRKCALIVEKDGGPTRQQVLSELSAGVQLEVVEGTLRQVESSDLQTDRFASQELRPNTEGDDRDEGDLSKPTSGPDVDRDTQTLHSLSSAFVVKADDSSSLGSVNNRSARGCRASNRRPVAGRAGLSVNLGATCAASKADCSEVGKTGNLMREATLKLSSVYAGDPTARAELVAMQKTGPSAVATIYRYVADGTDIPREALEGQSAEFRKLASLRECLSLRGQVLVLRTIVCGRARFVGVCPVGLRSTVIWSTHELLHGGVARTCGRIRLNWWWPGMRSEVRRTVRTCGVCQAAKHGRMTPVGHRQRLQAGRPWQVVSVDLVGPFNRTSRGNSVILVLADHFTRWRDALPLSDGTAESVARALDDRVFSYFGLPERIHTDQGSQFEGNLMKELCKIWGVNKSRTTPYHPQGNGMVERGNKDLGDSLRSLLLGGCHLDWDLLLPHIMRGIRAHPHTVVGETPNYLMLGREVRLPDQLVFGGGTLTLDDEPLPRERYAVALTERMEAAHQFLRDKQFSLRTADSEEPHLFAVGDKVLIKNQRRVKGVSPKLMPKFVGPYIVTKSFPNHTYLVEAGGKMSVESEQRLKLFIPPSSSRGQAPQLLEPARQPSRTGARTRRRAGRRPEPDTAPQAFMQSTGGLQPTGVDGLASSDVQGITTLPSIGEHDNDVGNIEHAPTGMDEQNNIELVEPEPTLSDIGSGSGVSRQPPLSATSSRSGTSVNSRRPNNRVQQPSVTNHNDGNHCDTDISLSNGNGTPHAERDTRTNPSVTANPPSTGGHVSSSGRSGRVRRPPAWLQDYISKAAV